MPKEKELQAPPPAVEPVNDPFVRAPAPPKPPEEPEPTKEEKKAAEDAAKEAAALAKAREKYAAQQAKENAANTVKVRAVRRGFYPAAGQIRNPGDVFDYVPVKGPDGELEAKLPSWMVDVEGEMESRAPGEESGMLPASTFIEISGAKGEDVTVRKGGASRKVI